MLTVRKGDVLLKKKQKGRMEEQPGRWWSSWDCRLTQTQTEPERSSRTAGSLTLADPPTRPHLCQRRETEEVSKTEKEEVEEKRQLTCPAVSHSCSPTGFPSTTTITEDKDSSHNQTATEAGRTSSRGQRLPVKLSKAVGT